MKGRLYKHQLIEPKSDLSLINPIHIDWSLDVIPDFLLSVNYIDMLEKKDSSLLKVCTSSCSNEMRSKVDQHT